MSTNSGKSGEVASEDGKLTESEAKVDDYLIEQDAAFFSELEKGTGLNPKSLMKALDGIARKGYAVGKVVLKGSWAGNWQQF